MRHSENAKYNQKEVSLLMHQNEFTGNNPNVPQQKDKLKDPVVHTMYYSLK